MALRVTHPTPIPVAMARAGTVLPVPWIEQEQDNWCWAGCADMILDYYGDGHVEQCDLANWAFHQNGCCGDGSSSLCDQPLSDACITELFTTYGLQRSYNNRSVSLDTLQAEISAERPVEVAFSWTGGGGHVVLVVGWDRDGNGTYLHVHDPNLGRGEVYYVNLLMASGRGVWDATWTNIRR